LERAISRKRSKSLRGQAVVLLVARSADDRILRKQLRYLEEVYQQFASKKVVFAVALREGEGPIPSDIPMAVVNDGPASRRLSESMTASRS
jgi:tagatose-1,6-bisphosphate aldolase